MPRGPKKRRHCHKEWKPSIKKDSTTRIEDNKGDKNSCGGLNAKSHTCSCIWHLVPSFGTVWRGYETLGWEALLEDVSPGTGFERLQLALLPVCFLCSLPVDRCVSSQMCAPIADLPVVMLSLPSCTLHLEL